MPQEKLTKAVRLTYTRDRRILVLGLTLAMLAIITVAVAITLYMRHQAELSSKLITENMAKSISQSTEGMIDSIDIALQASADEISRQHRQGKIDRAVATRYLDQQRHRLSDVSYLRATDEFGNIIYGDGIHAPIKSIADREYFLRLRDGAQDDLLASEHLIGRIAGKWAWLFARRINKADGSFGGVVFAGVLNEHIERHFSTFKLDYGGTISLRDEQLRMIARYTPSPTPVIPYGDRKLSVPFAAALKSSPDGASYVSGETSIDGISRTHYFQRNSKYGFYINVGIAGHTALADWRKQTAVIIGLMLAFVGAVITFAILLLRNWRRHERDLKKLVVSRRALHEEKRFVSQVLDSLPEHIAVVDWQGKLLSVNSSWKCFVRENNVTEDQIVIGANYLDYCVATKHLPHGEDGAAVAAGLQAVITGLSARFIQEYACHTASVQRWFMMIVTPLNIAPGGAVIVHTDITEQKLVEQRVSRLGYYDALTQLPNRRLLNERLTQALANTQRNGHFDALMLLDLDNFKSLNDTHGHDAGDALLIEAAKRLHACVREVDTVARLGGDEFVVILSELHTQATDAQLSARAVARKIQESLSATYFLPKTKHPERVVEHHCAVSLGMVLFRGHAVPQDELLRRCDTAMYQVKKSGGNGYLLDDGHGADWL